MKGVFSIIPISVSGGGINSTGNFYFAILHNPKDIFLLSKIEISFRELPSTISMSTFLPGSSVQDDSRIARASDTKGHIFLPLLEPGSVI